MFSTWGFNPFVCRLSQGLWGLLASATPSVFNSTNLTDPPPGPLTWYSLWHGCLRHTGDVHFLVSKVALICIVLPHYGLCFAATQLFDVVNI